MQVSILRRRGHVTSPVLVVKLAEHRTQHQRHILSSSSESTAQQFFDQENAIVDRKIQGVCRGC
jgi:hypothetical protein